MVTLAGLLFLFEEPGVRECQHFVQINCCTNIRYIRKLECASYHTIIGPLLLSNINVRSHFTLVLSVACRIIATSQVLLCNNIFSRLDVISGVVSKVRFLAGSVC